MTQDFQGSVIWCHLAVSGDGPRTPRHSRSHSFTFERLNGLPVDGARSKNAPTPSTSYVSGPLSVRTAFALARQVDTGFTRFWRCFSASQVRSRELVNSYPKSAARVRQS